MNKYEQISEFISQNYKPLNDWLFFNTSTMEAENASLNTIGGNGTITTYIDGTKEIELTFAVGMIKSYDTGTSTINIDAINEVDNFIRWIGEQNNLENYPNLGDNITVYELEALDTVPTLSVDPSQNLAKYQFNCVIRYLERK